MCACLRLDFLQDTQAIRSWFTANPGKAPDFFFFFFLILLWFRIWLESEFNVGRIEVANHPSRIAGMPAS